MKCCKEYMAQAWSSTKRFRFEYLQRLEEAEKRDHRKLGKKWIYFTLEKKAQAQFFGMSKGWSIISKIS